MKFYRQCKLRNGNVYTVGWIDAIHARIGNWVKMKSDESEWIVAEVWSKLSKEYVEEHERDYRKQRKASDILSGTRYKQGT
jgi:hypothetical protein